MEINWLDILSPLNPPKQEGMPLYAQLRDRLAESIQSGQVPLDTKLPTNRQLAGLLRIDRSTVTRALGELASLGMIESHVGRGTFVRAKASQKGTFDKSDFASRIDWTQRFSRASRITAELLARQPSSTDDDDLISFSGGSPASESIPYDQLKVIVNLLTKQAATNQLFDYSPAEGDALLRDQVMEYLQRQGIFVSDDELLILSGSQQGIDLVSGAFIDQSDEVIIEQPTYFWALCNFRARQARLIPVPMDEEGMKVDLVEPLLSRHNPKLIYVIPDFQNPTGACLSLARRERLIELANFYGVPIFEDNFAGDLYYERKALPSLRSLPDSETVVIHQGTFSKALCPGLRVGWLVAPAQVIARIRMAKRANDLSTNSMAQVVLANYLKNGLYSEHLDRIKQTYRRLRDTMLRSLREHLPDLYTVGEANQLKESGTLTDQAILCTNPRGGLFVWVKLPAGLSSRELLKYAEREGVTFSPGDLFFANNEGFEYFRLCFIENDERTIERGIERLGKAVKRLLARALKTRASASSGAAPRASKSVLV